VIALLLGQQQEFTKIPASFLNGRTKLGLFITQERIGLRENPWNQESFKWKINH
jgi:hypothetical protein